MTLALPILLPLATALLIALTGRWPKLRDSVSIAGGVLTALAAFQLAAQGTLSWQLLDFGAGIRLQLASEPLGLLFSLVSSSLWPVTAIYAGSYLRHENDPHQTRFFVFLAVSIAAAQSIALSGNLFTLFIGYEVLTLATWPLVTHWGTDVARQGGRVYLGYLLPTSVALLLPAILVVQHLAGTTDFRPEGLLADAGLSPVALGLLYALFLLGIGKAALMPVHRWLPAAMVAPAPVSALLHAVAVVKAGVFCVLKVTVYVFGVDLLNLTGAAQPMLWLATFSLLAASVIALHSDNLKHRLAYSTVSQLAYVVVGAALATSLGILGGGLHIVMHAFGKITLFFCAGAIYAAAHKTLVSELDGLGRRMPFTFAAFTLGALSIIGLPPLGGTWSKWFLMSASADSGEVLLLAVFAVSSLLNIVYLLEIPLRGFMRPGPEGAATGLHEAPLGCVLALCLTAAGCVAWFVFPGPLLGLLSAWRPT